MYIQYSNKLNSINHTHTCKYFQICVPFIYFQITPPYFVKIPPASPYSELFARAMTSSSVSKVKTDITEPKTSSLDTVMWSSQLTRIQGLTKYPPKLGSGVTLFPPHNTDAPCVHNGNGITCSKFVQMKHMSTMMDESNCVKDL